MAIVYMGGYISGGQFNPALSIGCWLRGLMSTKTCALYCLSQFLGGLMGGGVARFVIGSFLECGCDDLGKVRAMLLPL
jgi:aquaporin Z